MITLGKKVKDGITGVTGIATARTEYLHGTPRVCVEPRVELNGKPVDLAWLDESRLMEVE